MFKNTEKIRILDTVYPTNFLFRLIGLMISNKKYKHIYLFLYILKTLIDLYFIYLTLKRKIQFEESFIEKFYHVVTMIFWLFSLTLIYINYINYNKLTTFFLNLNQIERKINKLQIKIDHKKYKKIFFFYTILIILRFSYHLFYLIHTNALEFFQYLRFINTLWFVSSEIQIVIYIWAVNMYFVAINKFLNNLNIIKINLLNDLTKSYCELCEIYNDLIKLLGFAILTHVLLKEYDVAFVIFRENHIQLNWQHFDNIWALEPFVCIVGIVFTFQSTLNQVR